MVLVQVSKAAIAMLLFVGVVALDLHLAPHAVPAVPTPTSTETTSSTTVSSSTSSSSASPPLPDSATILLQGNQFVNGTVHVAVGATITWIHRDGMTAHTVTSDTGLFDSSPNCAPAGGVGVPLPQVCMVDGDHFAFTFKEAGSYPYHCKIHGAMTDTIEVG